MRPSQPPEVRTDKEGSANCMRPQPAGGSPSPPEEGGPGSCTGGQPAILVSPEAQTHVTNPSPPHTHTRRCHHRATPPAAAVGVPTLSNLEPPSSQPIVSESATPTTQPVVAAYLPSLPSATSTAQGPTSSSIPGDQGLSNMASSAPAVPMQTILLIESTIDDTEEIQSKENLLRVSICYRNSTMGDVIINPLVDKLSL